LTEHESFLAVNASKKASPSSNSQEQNPISVLVLVTASTPHFFCREDHVGVFAVQGFGADL
jgi:hypothetical protein